MMLFARRAELSVGEVAERAGIGQATASQQQTLLRRGRVVTSRREQGRVLAGRPRRRGRGACRFAVVSEDLLPTVPSAPSRRSSHPPQAPHLFAHLPMTAVGPVEAVCGSPFDPAREIWTRSAR
ncbi:hypothetical protein ACTMSW_30575 [Micromonospora sp. BQ11]|uniref:hypothetical protein n=1 Tax=Micromonospora sp. BQ11 TaxID=3452212 RepID=UPI003F8A3DDF